MKYFVKSPYFLKSIRMTVNILKTFLMVCVSPPSKGGKDLSESGGKTHIFAILLEVFLPILAGPSQS